MISFYQTLYYPANKNYEYQKRNNNWYYRSKGSNDSWSLTSSGSAKALGQYFEKHGGFLYNISPIAKLTSAAVVIGGIYYLVFTKKQSTNII